MTRPATPPTRKGVRRSHLWLGLWLAAAAAISALKIGDAIDPTTAFILFAGSMGMLIPMIRAMARENGGNATSAGTSYSKRMALFGAIYVLDLGIAIKIDDLVAMTGWTTVLFALLPTVPILGMIWAMARYLIEEKDEFLRYRAAMAALIGLGVLLALATFVGFLERFGLDLHPEGWFALPVWAMGMGAGRAWLARSDRAEDEA